MAYPVVAIVGRPNVGKSMLFNRIIGSRVSIVEDTPGVTRDRIYAYTEWNGRRFSVVDTGGIEPSTKDELLLFMREQAEITIENADVILLVTDLEVGLTAADKDVADMLLKSKKPVIAVVNKADRIGKVSPDFYEFYNLGLGEPMAVSALHGHGTGDLLDACVALFPPRKEEDAEDDSIKVAVIGKPNVGKSSLVNRLLGENRVVVSNVPGTTRDAVDVDIENEYGKFTFIDTAGMRKRAKVDDRIERFSILRATMAIERSDVCVIMIDAQDGVTEQDTKVAGFAHENGKACIIAVNKWDIIEKDDRTMNVMLESIRNSLVFMAYAPVIFISAKTGQRVGRLCEKIVHVYGEASKRISTGQINDMLADATAKVQPPSDRGKRLKVFYMTQAGIRPPSFVLFCNNSDLFHFSYQRYLKNRIRDTFGFEGTPINFIIREREEE